MVEVSTEYGFDLIRTERDLFEMDHCAAEPVWRRSGTFPMPSFVALAMHHEEPKKSPNLFSLVRSLAIGGRRRLCAILPTGSGRMRNSSR